MSIAELGVIAASALAAGGGLAFIYHVVRTGGRDRPKDPEGVRRLVRSTTSERTGRVAAE
ncbi:hypothetical protein [Rubellimicrobium arenae]|uniref:hypothetical protein n=1 Tax=Rubellimicrobium arenae TaxID=2817372 RepID=UPI001B3123F8|nr:hypothetical protein [Rubellimicrobium arenae]